ncbi:hypothetical protein O3P69_002342 [Scylla paramamosain]|uniref:Chitin-binding type-2 domain-containing protein n=1 Tax=Scylla paramamosain TaxID=85552 RepID=A0AAW0V6Z0_SCYPA
MVTASQRGSVQSKVSVLCQERSDRDRGGICDVKITYGRENYHLPAIALEARGGASAGAITVYKYPLRPTDSQTSLPCPSRHQPTPAYPHLQRRTMKDRPALSLGYLLVAYCVMTAVNGGTLECRREGRFPHPENCASYVDCFRNADDVLVAREGHCHGYPYSPEKRRCVDHSEKPDCVTKGIRNSFRASDFNYLCAQDESGAGCVNWIKDKCSCKKVGLVKDPYDAAYFHYCGSNGAIPEIIPCEADKEFSEETQTCEVNPGEPEIPSCDGKTGTFVNPNDCSWSYTCLPGGTVRASSCGNDEYFKDGLCEKKCSFGEPAVLEPCTGPGFLIYPDDCTKYIFCTDTGESPEVKFCSEGFFFNEDTKRCTDTTLPTSVQHFASALVYLLTLYFPSHYNDNLGVSDVVAMKCFPECPLPPNASLPALYHCINLSRSAITNSEVFPSFYQTPITFSHQPPAAFHRPSPGSFSSTSLSHPPQPPPPSHPPVPTSTFPIIHYKVFP